MCKLAALLAALLVASPVAAQPQTSKDLTGTTCPGAGCLDVTVDSFAATGVQISNTFVGTITFRHTIESTSAPTYVDLPMLPPGGGTAVTTATAPGIWTASTTAKKIRIVFTAYTSGTATVSTISTTASRATGIAIGSGDGVPGGVSGTLQYNNAGDFGGASTWKFTGGNAVTSTATGTWLLNNPTDASAGNFDFMIGVASNDVPPGDTRPDHVASIGWNGSGSASALHANGTRPGASTLVFESYCSYGTGCLGGNGGQSETYFNLDDGKGGVVRPLGFFQQKAQDDITHNVSVIARADTWGFFDAPQSNLLMSVTAAHGVQDAQVTLNGLLVGVSPDGTNGDWIYQDGQSLIRSAATGVAVAPTTSVVLAGPGETTVTVQGNHFALSSVDIEGTGGTPRLRLGAASATNYPKLFGSGSDDIILEPAGSTTNIQLTLQSKGTGPLYLNPGGPLRINGGVGVTASGSSCTITQITKGIITGASCTP